MGEREGQRWPREGRREGECKREAGDHEQKMLKFRAKLEGAETVNLQFWCGSDYWASLEVGVEWGGRVGVIFWVDIFPSGTYLYIQVLYVLLRVHL